jgi:hypothetical protein
MARQIAVNNAKRNLAEAEDKIRKVKTWNQNYDHCADPIAKRLEGVRQLLEHDMPKAIAYLVGVQRTLDAYAQTQAPSAESEPASASEASAETPAAATGEQP